MLPPTYTAFGTIDATGLATLDKVAAAGVVGGGGDGKPAVDVTIESVRLGLITWRSRREYPPKIARKRAAFASARAGSLRAEWLRRRW